MHISTLTFFLLITSSIAFVSNSQSSRIGWIKPTTTPAGKADSDDETIIEKATSVAGKSWEKTKNVASDTAKSTKDLVTNEDHDGVADKAASLTRKGYDKTKDAVSSVKDTVTGAASSVKDSVKDKTKSTLDKADEMLSKE
jgi:hypothetical protein